MKPESNPLPSALAPSVAPSGASGGQQAAPAGGSRVQRVRHELKRRELTVLGVDDVTPNFRRVTLGGESLADFVSASFDDHVKLIFDASGDAPVMRDYTPRRHDAAARELVIEFAQHGDGPAAAWAAQAVPGQSLTVGGPRGSFIVPVDYDWHLLAGDETALPAVARRLEELPPGTRVIALLNVPESDRRHFQTTADVDLRWVDGDEALLAAARALTLPDGEGYAWCAGEAAAMTALRRVLVEEKGHDRHAIRASAYWKRGASHHHEHLE
ncbi:NADPH-dependent ferric siderophore reductase [Roseateles aquatilis]|uniref:NADPH-dependent ferric siderophore reductase n=1 Tax=Roseateles aquatilis TaxID=431061 RepID=A0A246J4S7_9BURK|nr:siderophore-interacting protein [Roseateles aquatilis]OWQ87596.1 NADPH-dependent ferric siderophore reductase [Roseateles aquatilis]